MWSIVDKNDLILESDLTLYEAESLLCRYCNEDVDVYLVEQMT